MVHHNQVGIPRTCRFDAGNSFKSSLMEAFTQVLKIDVKLFATPYHKTTQGLVERSNKIIEDLLHPYIRGDAKFWDKILNFLTFAHNQIPNRTMVSARRP